MRLTAPAACSPAWSGAWSPGWTEPNASASNGGPSRARDRLRRESLCLVREGPPPFPCGTSPLPRPATHPVYLHGWLGGGVGRCRKPATDVEGAPNESLAGRETP